MSVGAGMGARAGTGGRQIINVNLSRSWRQDCCMAYSAGRQSGSEAVRVWISGSFIHSW